MVTADRIWKMQRDIYRQVADFGTRYWLSDGRREVYGLLVDVRHETLRNGSRLVLTMMNGEQVYWRAPKQVCVVVARKWAARVVA
jgi:hypothetical protein